MKILHTSDWHVGRTIRGRSRAQEHIDVLSELAGLADREQVDVALVVGDLFDTAAPTPEAEEIVFRGLLDLASTGATVIALAGNHDNPRRLSAVEPVLALGRIVTRSGFRGPDDGGVIEVVSRDGSERAKVAVLPFLSQRYVVRADDLMDQGRAAAEHTGSYDQRVRNLIAKLVEGFGTDTVNLVAAHLTAGGDCRFGGGERLAHTVFEYQVNPAAFPANAHYVALGHLHRRQQVKAPGQVHYCGSPLQLDFGEVDDIKATVLVEARPGRPATITDVPLTSGRRLRKVGGTLEELRLIAPTVDAGAAYLKVEVRERARVGLADEVRDLFPDAVDVLLVRPEGVEPAGGQVPGQAGAAREARPPAELFAEYLASQSVEDPALTALFAEVLEEVSS